MLHWKSIIFDNLHIIWNLVSKNERKIYLQKIVMFLLLKKYVISIKIKLKFTKKYNLSNEEVFWKMDKINLDVLFNNKLNLKELFEVLLIILNDQACLDDIGSSLK